MVSASDDHGQPIDPFAQIHISAGNHDSAEMCIRDRFLLEDISFSFSSVLETEIVYKFDSEFFTAIPIHESVSFSFIIPIS